MQTFIQTTSFTKFLYLMKCILAFDSFCTKMRTKGLLIIFSTTQQRTPVRERENVSENNVILKKKKRRATKFTPTITAEKDVLKIFGKEFAFSDDVMKFT